MCTTYPTPFSASLVDTMKAFSSDDKAPQWRAGAGGGGVTIDFQRCFFPEIDVCRLFVDKLSPSFQPPQSAKQHGMIKNKRDFLSKKRYQMRRLTVQNFY
jgi:hypothetical protein